MIGTYSAPLRRGDFEERQTLGARSPRNPTSTVCATLAQTEDRRYLELKLCAAADVRSLLGAKDGATGAAALTVFSCLSGGDYDRGADRIGPKHAAKVVRSLLDELPEVQMMPFGAIGGLDQSSGES